MILQALTLMGVDANEISVVSDSILDWIDPDDLPRVAGAESDYYQGLAVPYYAKNAPIDDLSELLLVKGILDHPEIYWGGAATNHTPAAVPAQTRPRHGAGADSRLSVRLDEHFHAVFHRENQHQHRR